MCDDKLGGLGETIAATEELQALVQSLKSQVDEKLQKTFPVFHAISFAAQVVAGTNYFVKIVVGAGDEYLHVRIDEPLPHVKVKPSVVDVQCGKKLFDEITYF